MKMLNGTLTAIVGAMRAHFGWREGARSWRAAAADASGVTAIEYAMIASLIAVLIVVSIATLGQTLNGWFLTIGSNL